MDSISIERVTRVASSDALHQLAILHKESLPDSILSFMDYSLVEVYYSYLMSSDKDYLFIAKEDKVVGVAVLSSDSNGLMKRFFLRSFFSFHFIKGFYLSLSGIIPVFKNIFKKVEKVEDLNLVPEVVQLFVDKKYRDGGVGGQLLNQVEIFLKELNASRYFVKTLTSSENKAVNFYEKRKFSKVAVRQNNGKEYVYMMRLL